MHENLIIRKALPQEAVLLSQLAIRSKAYWGYSAEFMQACVEELSMSADDIKNPDCHYVVATVDEAIAGFYALEGHCGDEIELGALFVDPDYIGNGIGKALIEEAKQHALMLGADRMNIQGDPHAEKFYRACGARLTGSSESDSIPGRFLPTFQVTL